MSKLQNNLCLFSSEIFLLSAIFKFFCSFTMKTKLGFLQNIKRNILLDTIFLSIIRSWEYQEMVNSSHALFWKLLKILSAETKQQNFWLSIAKMQSSFILSDTPQTKWNFFFFQCRHQADYDFIVDKKKKILCMLDIRDIKRDRHRFFFTQNKIPFTS